MIAKNAIPIEVLDVSSSALFQQDAWRPILKGCGMRDPFIIAPQAPMDLVGPLRDFTIFKPLN